MSPGRNLFGGVKFGGLATSSPLKFAVPQARWGLDLSSSSSSDITLSDPASAVAAPQVLFSFHNENQNEMRNENIVFISLGML